MIGCEFGVNVFIHAVLAIPSWVTARVMSAVVVLMFNSLVPFLVGDAFGCRVAECSIAGFALVVATFYPNVSASLAFAGFGFAEPSYFDVRIFIISGFPARWIVVVVAFLGGFWFLVERRFVVNR